MSCVDKKAVRDVIGAPFKLHGRDPINGFDCWGLVVWLMWHDRNIAIDDDWQYNNLENVSTIFTQEYAKIKTDSRSRWAECEAKDAHVVLLAFGGIIEHIGYMCSEKHFVHIVENGVVRIDSIDSLFWKNRVAGFFQWLE